MPKADGLGVRLVRSCRWQQRRESGHRLFDKHRSIVISKSRRWNSGIGGGERMKEQFSVKWIGLQVFAIVGSILLAFAIDAWWENRQELEIEHAILVSLHRDFLQSRIDLDVALATFENWHDQFARFQSATPAELTQLDNATAGSILMSLYPGFTFDATSGTLDALVSDGRLALIEDTKLRGGLVTWLRSLADIAENEADIRAGALRAQIGTEKHGGPFHGPVAVLGAVRPDLSNLPSATASKLAAMREDPDFMARARSHQYQTAFYVRELRVLSELLDANLTILESVVPDSPVNGG